MAKDYQIRGYVLEEILAFLVGNSGYSLIPDASYDEQELVDQSNGLAVRGRGATHQADVLGQLTWVPAFTYPLRLFVEAKYYGGNRRVGLSIVRSGIGILEDVNQNFLAVPGSNPVLLRRRYSYRYALFSASGFHPNGVTLAYAHGISLIDLSTPAFSPLLSAVRTITQGVMRAEANGVSTSIPLLRRAIRALLDPEPGDSTSYLELLPEETIAQLLRVRDKASVNDLLIGVPDVPFVLVLQPDNLEEFLQFGREHPRHRVHLQYRVVSDSTEWECALSPDPALCDQ